MSRRGLSVSIILSGALLAGCSDSEGIKEGSRDEDALRYSHLMHAVGKRVARRIDNTSFYQMREGDACYQVATVPNSELSRELLGRLQKEIAHDVGHSLVASLRNPDECKKIRG